MKKRSIVFAQSLLLVSGLAHAGPTPSQNGAANFMGTEQVANVSTDPSKPVPRGYIIPTATAIPGGARLTVDIYYMQLNTPVTLRLDAAINDGTGNVQEITLKTLSDKVIDNANTYHTTRTFDLSYAEINQILAKMAPLATNLKVGPGSPLFVAATMNTHNWGGVSRAGIFFLPEDPTAAAPGSGTTAATNTRRVDDLEVAYPITRNITTAFNDANGNGLKLGGQVRSHVESEGKYVVEPAEFGAIQKKLFDLAADQSKVDAALGPGWKFILKDRYMQKDAQGNLMKDAAGLPIPDPMVDTYYDNDNYDAAKNDIAIRYRFTAGNGFGDWELKPGTGKVSSDGVDDRVEYGFDATDNKPGSIAKFVDSMNSINPFRTIRDAIPGATPSDFFKPSVKLSDTRYKFMAEHTSGVSFEVSLDNVKAESLRSPSLSPATFMQVEMEIEHLATSATMAKWPGFRGINLAALDGKAFLDGSPVLHDVRDLEPTSPLKAAHAGDFQVATAAIVALRDNLLGKDWISGPQKNALATYELGLIQDNEASPSVKTMIAEEKKLEAVRGTSGAAPRVVFAACGSVFD